jgi:hypothetical protein
MLLASLEISPDLHLYRMSCEDRGAQNANSQS